MANQFQAQILTPVGKVYDGEVTGVQVPGETGSFEVKVNHAPIISTLDIGPVRLTTPQRNNRYFAISGGFLEVNDNKLTLLAESAEEADKIDIDRARSAKERALGILADKQTEPDRERMERALRRAENRLKVAEKGKKG